MLMNNIGPELDPMFSDRAILIFSQLPVPETLSLSTKLPRTGVELFPGRNVQIHSLGWPFSNDLLVQSMASESAESRGIPEGT
jgi:hypothetical protein